MNLLTRVNWEARVNGQWREIADELADYLLFVGEAPPPARVQPRRVCGEACGPERRRIAKGDRYESWS